MSNAFLSKSSLTTLYTGGRAYLNLYEYDTCIRSQLWVRIPLMARCTQHNIIWSSLSV